MFDASLGYIVSSRPVWSEGPASPLLAHVPIPLLDTSPAGCDRHKKKHDLFCPPSIPSSLSWDALAQGKDKSQHRHAILSTVWVLWVTAVAGNKVAAGNGGDLTWARAELTDS